LPAEKGVIPLPKPSRQKVTSARRGCVKRLALPARRAHATCRNE